MRTEQAPAAFGLDLKSIKRGGSIHAFSIFIINTSNAVDLCGGNRTPYFMCLAGYDQQVQQLRLTERELGCYSLIVNLFIK